MTVSCQTPQNCGVILEVTAKAARYAGFNGSLVLRPATPKRRKRACMIADPLSLPPSSISEVSPRAGGGLARREGAG